MLGERRDLALLFKKLATLRTDAKLFSNVDELKWRGPTDRFEPLAKTFGNDKLIARAAKAAKSAAA